MSGALPSAAASALRERGFVVIPGPVHPNRMELLVGAYTAAMASATSEEIRVGSTSTKLSDLVNRGAARTVRPRTTAQELHVDVPRTSGDWPLLGFIVMIDEFRPDNGATRFIPGSHRSPGSPADTLSDERAAYDGEVLACGPAGSLLVFNGSAWHGHTANTSSAPRRSIQGAFIPRGGCAALDFAARMHPETHQRLSPLARHVLAL